MKAAEVVAKQQAVVSATADVDRLIRELIAMAPIAETPDKRKVPMLSPDAQDSLRHISRALKVINLDALVVSQEIMGYTEEAKEAAIEAQKGKLKIIGQDGKPVEEAPANG